MKISIIGGGPGGLYFALLTKKAWPTHQITVYERNRPNDTFGFGVVFSDETLGIFRDYDEPSYEAIRRNFAYWGDVDIHFKGQLLKCGGNGFAGCSRQSLLLLLQHRCQELGVQFQFEYEVDPAALNNEPFANSDLILAADGINSRIRETFKAHFGTQVDLRHNYFCWLGSTRPLNAFKYFFKETPHGLMVAHAYQYEPGHSTWVIEMPPNTWQGYGFGEMTEEEYTAVLQSVFAPELEDHPFLTNRSLWRRFPTIRNATWVKNNIVLLGDAQATAHYTIGSGTKLAMESAIALFESLRTSPTVPTALAHFEQTRREEVSKLQYAAEVSLQWFEVLERHWHQSPEQFAFGVMSRSKQITYENLILRDPGFVERVQNWFLDGVRSQGLQITADTPPLFTPFLLREMRLGNRVVVSPMAQYSAEDGMPNEWHLVHLGSRAVGGAGLLFVEMTCPAPDARITPGCTGLWNEAQRDVWARIVAFVHANTTTKICMQLGHAGRKGSTQLGWQDENHPLPTGNWPVYSASPLPYFPDSQTPLELTQADMRRIRDEFVVATRYANEAGFDMLELHMAHGYLLASFISPLTNQRTDAYGGSIANRMRFPLEVFQAMRAVWPLHKPMSARISAADWHPGGLSEEDLIVLTRMLKEAGADLMDVSTGQTVAEQKPIYGRMYQTPFADTVRQEVGIATMAVGNITTADQVNTILLQGRADLVALARPHLTNPYFTQQAAAWYNYRGQFWPNQYLSGRNQLYRLAEKEREEQQRMRQALRPPTHEVGK